MEIQYDIAIIGGGPAGSTAALYLSRKGFRTCVIEKQVFPRETLCGEFLSGEAVRIINELELTSQFQSLYPNRISTFRFCPEGVRSFSANLTFTAYGLKRGAFDSMLLNQAHLSGATIYQPMVVERIDKIKTGYMLIIAGSKKQIQIKSHFVAGAYGKSDVFHKTAQRNIPNRRTGLMGVKLHIPKEYLYNLPHHEIQIYTGNRIYCGINMVNDNTVTLCFLAEQSKTNDHPRTRILELLKFNRHFAKAISAEVIEKLSTFPIHGTADIYFGRKSKFEDCIFKIGDSAQMIAPLAGDGISMAMESAKILALAIEEGHNKKLSTEDIVHNYDTRWRTTFWKRIIIARTIQQLLFTKFGRITSILILSGFPTLLSYIIEKTRD